MLKVVKLRERGWRFNVCGVVLNAILPKKCHVRTVLWHEKRSLLKNLFKFAAELQRRFCKGVHAPDFYDYMKRYAHLDSLRT